RAPPPAAARRDRRRAGPPPGGRPAVERCGRRAGQPCARPWTRWLPRRGARPRARGRPREHGTLGGLVARRPWSTVGEPRRGRRDRRVPPTAARPGGPVAEGAEPGSDPHRERRVAGGATQPPPARKEARMIMDLMDRMSKGTSTIPTHDRGGTH